MITPDLLKHELLNNSIVIKLKENSITNIIIAQIIGDKNENILYNVEFEKSLTKETYDYIFDICFNFNKYFDDLKNQLIPEIYYYIQNGYVGNSMCWWALDSKGYTTDITKAHKFTEKEMLSIIENNKYRAWKCDYIDNQKNAHIMIIDSQHFDADWNENVIN